MNWPAERQFEVGQLKQVERRIQTNGEQLLQKKLAVHRQGCLYFKISYPSFIGEYFILTADRLLKKQVWKGLEYLKDFYTF